jgi:hypothetical protein
LARAAGLPLADGWFDATTLFVVVWLVRSWPEAGDPVVAAGIGAAVTFGGAVHFLTGMPTLVLNGLFVMLGSLFGVPQFLAIAEAVWRVSSNRSPTPSQLFLYFWLAPFLTAGIAVFASKLLWRQRHASSEVASADGAGSL